MLFLLLANNSLAGQRVFCTRVIDGDTFHAEGVGKVRLIGVDTPELGRQGNADEPGAVEAREFLMEAIEGRFVVLDFDETRRDKYGRTLAYVTDPKGRVVNEEILRRRLGEPIRFFPYKMKEKYLKIYRDGIKE